MKLNPPSQVRAALYVLVMIGTPVAAYLQIKGYIGTPEIALWTALTSAVALMAGFNVTGDN